MRPTWLLSRHISREKHGLKGYIHSSVHCSIIYNSQDMEATSESINRWTDKEDVVHIYYGVLPIKKERNKPFATNLVGCPSPILGVYPNPCPLSQWCHPIISSSIIPFSFCSQSFPASGSFLMSRLFTSGGQSIGASASASLLLVNIQDWSPLGLAGLISLQFKGLSVLIHSNQWTTDQQEWSLVSSLWWKN